MQTKSTLKPLTRKKLLRQGETLKKKIQMLPKLTDGMPDFSKASSKLRAQIDAYVEKMAANQWLPE